MPKFPVDAPKSKVLKALGQPGFALVRDQLTPTAYQQPQAMTATIAQDAWAHF